MLLDLSKIRGARERYEKIYKPEDFAPEADSFRIAAPVSLAFDIIKDKSQFELIGRVTTTLELPCSRCLEPFSWPVQSDFDLRYQPHSTNVGEGEHEIEEDDLATAFYDDDEIDLGQLMREQFYLALPMKPLCRDGCLGLCPICGEDLNAAPEHEHEREPDPRWAKLRELKFD